MPGIFISYSRKDADFARKLATSLEKMGADVWIDVEDIPAGLKWSTAIQQGLDSADLLIIVLSPDSMASTNVEDEWQYFLDTKKPVIPLLLHETKIHFQLNRIQWVDFLNQPYDRALLKLHEQLEVNGVSLQLPPPASPASTAAAPMRQTVAPQPATHTKPEPRNAMPIYISSGVVVVALIAIIGVFILANNNRGDNTATQTAVALAGRALQATQEPNTPTDVPTLTPSDEPTQLPTDIPTATIAPTDTPTVTATPTDEPFVINPALHNDDWQAVRRNINGVAMVLVPPGTFQLGASDSAAALNAQYCREKLDSITCNDLLGDERPNALVTINAPFWIDMTEVTNVTYNNGIGDILPKMNVDWNEADAHCRSRGAHLPTEVEWEYAASGPDNWNYPWGNEWATNRNLANICDSHCGQIWQEPAINDGYAELAPVGQYPDGASWVGALDMVGNVWEYTSSVYAAYPYYANIVENNVDTLTSRTLRGGGWTWIQGEATTSARAPFARGVGSRSNFYGFRCARDYQEGDLEAYSE